VWKLRYGIDENYDDDANNNNNSNYNDSATSNNSLSSGWRFSLITLILRVSQKVFLSVYKSYKLSSILSYCEKNEGKSNSFFGSCFFDNFSEILKHIIQSQVSEIRSS